MVRALNKRCEPYFLLHFLIKYLGISGNTSNLFVVLPCSLGSGGTGNPMPPPIRRSTFFRFAVIRNPRIALGGQLFRRCGRIGSKNLKVGTFQRRNRFAVYFHERCMIALLPRDSQDPKIPECWILKSPES